MAVVISDRRTVWNSADSATGWQQSISGSPLLYTSSPTPVELTGCMGCIVSLGTNYVWYPTTAVNLSDTLIFVWVLANGIMDTLANGGITLYVGDGTDSIGYEVAGSDIAVFRHSEGQPFWQCLVLDSTSLPATFTTYGGLESSLTWSAISRIGAGFKTLAKALGGVENCFIDVIRYGALGLRITGGSSSDVGTFEQIAAEDASNADTKAYGICRKLGAGVYGLQSMITLGDSPGTGSVYFKDTGSTVVFEDRGFSTTRYQIVVEGNSTGTTVVWLVNCNLICPEGVGAKWDSSDADVDTVTLDSVLFSGYINGVLFSNDATVGPDHEIFGCTFDSCGQISPGKTDFHDNTIISSSAYATGALLIGSSGTAGLSELSFVSGGSGHALYVTSTGTFDLEDFTYEGYGSSGTTDAVLYNNSGGAVTINVLGGDVPTVRNGSGASTTVNNYKTVLVTIRDSADSSPIENARVYLIAAAGGDLTEGTVILTGLTDEDGELSTEAFNFTDDQPVTGWARKGSTSPLYRTVGLGGVITDEGYNTTAFMVLDE